MPINVFGNSNSNDNNNNKTNTSLFVQKAYLKANYIEADIEEDIDLKNHFRIINLLDPLTDQDVVNKIYIDKNIVDIIKRNIQNDYYISFPDNDNNEYKLTRYEDKLLTDETLFQLQNLGNQTNTKWNYEILDQNGSDFINFINCSKKLR